MEDYYLFLTILKQKHLLKKISCNFSWQLLSNLSKACPKISEAINNAKKKATIHFPNELFIACTLDTDHNGTEIKMEHNYSCKSFDFQNISQSFLDIFLITEPPQPYAIKKFGIMVNNSLNEIPYIRKLTLSFSINQEMYYIQELINEIKNDKISEINILIEKDYSHQRWPPTPDITNYKIFDGFKNLEKISLYVEDLIATKRDKKIVDIASTIKGITIDILFRSIPKIEKNCLRNFKNLKIFVSRDNEPIELPCNVESCMISDLKYFLTNTISIKRKYKYDRCLEYYKKLSCFKKEYDIDGLIVGTILFNNFAELYNIQVYFDDIYRMHKWFD
ncbi:Hypothetical protein SRAE_1000096000 [Strongyloides ratti]|uniref:Uncharacterized protein n=1 Tax=Strongyloides ratti TaxID=34506 RepID=A0A090KYY1_STRRB|nr:Hypothetical protein SRAE_1000096000 [Strongyloides ratti]CEF62690.1 Hypothetical protein SRAE_1000096000 [Strongyloides ratti]